MYNDRKQMSGRLRWESRHGGGQEARQDTNGTRKLWGLMEMFTLIMVMSSLVYAMSKLIKSDAFNICSLELITPRQTLLKKQKRRPVKKKKNRNDH